MILSPNVFLRPFPKDLALIIGIENYDSLPDVKLVRKDDIIIKDYFVQILGVISISLKNRAKALLQYEIHKSKKGVCLLGCQ